MTNYTSTDKDPEREYLSRNRALWNGRTKSHVHSAFYDNDGFIRGRNTLNSIELELLGEIKGLDVLHLQCHFGQDTISLSRMGADCTGIDLSDLSIEAAKKLAVQTDVKVKFLCTDLYSLPEVLQEKFDLVFTSYGTVGWLPDLDRWAAVIAHFLKPGGRLVMADFHPVVWMFDDHFKEIKYSYFKKDPIVEVEQGSYAGPAASLQESVTWNHGLAEILSALLGNGLGIEVFREFDYSPYDCFKETAENRPGEFRIKGLSSKIPMVYALVARK